MKSAGTKQDLCFWELLVSSRWPLLLDRAEAFPVVPHVLHSGKCCSNSHRLLSFVPSFHVSGFPGQDFPLCRLVFTKEEAKKPADNYKAADNNPHS